MAKSPVRRALFILFIAAAIITMLMMFAQDQVTLKVRSAAGAEEPRHAAYIAALVGADLTYGNDYDVLTNGDQIFPPMLEAIQRREAPNQLRNLHLRVRRSSPTSSPRRWKRRRIAVFASTWSSTRSAAAG